MLSPRERWRRRAAMGLATITLMGFALMLEPVRSALSSISLVERSPLAGLGSIGVVAATLAALWPKLFSAAEHAARFIDNPGVEAASGAMSDVRDQLGRLVHQATRGARLVVFVDDLERCRPGRAVEVCEVASQLFDQKDIVTILIADMDAIAAAAEQMYSTADDPPAIAVAAGGRAADVGRRYLEKIVQSSSRFHPLAPRTCYGFCAVRIPRRKECPSRVDPEHNGFPPGVTPHGSKCGCAFAGSRPGVKAHWRSAPFSPHSRVPSLHSRTGSSRKRMVHPHLDPHHHLQPRRRHRPRQPQQPRQHLPAPKVPHYLICYSLYSRY